MKNIILLTLIFTVFLFTACSKDDSPAPAAPGVYVVGYENLDDQYHGQAKLWKDGVASNLSSPADYASAEDVFVSGQDVYVAGSVGSLTKSQPTIWKNGNATQLELTSSFIGGLATRIVVVGKDVYAIGYVSDSNYKKYATFWKNGKISIIEQKSGQIYFNGLAVSGSDVYIGGIEYVNSEGVATIWKNGVASRIGPVEGSTYTGIDDITIAGADVYALGLRQKEGADLEVVVWKNGVAGVIATNTEGIELEDIHVSGGDVYAAGFMYKQRKGRGVIWKNGVATELTDGTIFSAAKSIFAIDGDIYVTGFINVDYSGNGSSGSYRSAKLWKNGVVTDLSTNGSKFDSEALGIFVVK
ncbi:hypothetical protein [Xanthocytophaga flava]|uniref:hypothetical protein n=1 Tax=Xanthocytophaga flava TaxID=3048013 RepID=UPI0028D16D5E|nr:hypothetical protein [Xanthocytophaga flavus]MDJ1471065.1 hypothetical protein [Xanthocytophaga flavus]